jgi:hypothetical protein
MSSILSAISGHFSRVLILGTMLPIIMFIAIGVGVLLPVLPDWRWIVAFTELDREWQIVALLLFILIATGILQHLNGPIIRLYEGYSWQHSWIGHRRKNHHQAVFRRLTAEKMGLRALFDYANSRAEHKAKAAQLGGRRRQVELALQDEYPIIEDIVLPTRLGNVIRSFESYPLRRYGMDAVSLWPRLEAVMNKDHAATIDSAKAQFDFMINTSFLTALVAFGLLLSSLVGFLPTPQRLLIAVQFLALVITAYLFYRGAILRAQAWGAHVKSAFDLYRGDLLRKLGCMIVPPNAEEEKVLWEKITRRLIYGNPDVGLAPPYRQDYPYVLGHALGYRVDVTRAFVGEEYDVVEMRLNVVNSETDADRKITDVQVLEVLPDNTVYVAGSASITRADEKGTRTHRIRVRGTQPFRFQVGDLKPGERVAVGYRYRRFK